MFFPSKTTATLAQTTIAIANGVSPTENLQAMRDYAAEQVKLINEQQQNENEEYNELNAAAAAPTNSTIYSDPLPLTCVGSIKLCQNSSDCSSNSLPVITATAQYGQIYANVIPAYGLTIDTSTAQTVYQTSHYVNGVLNFSAPTLNKIYNGIN